MTAVCQNIPTFVPQTLQITNKDEQERKRTADKRLLEGFGAFQGKHQIHERFFP